MMVTFISQCEKKALKRTRRVLDAFANRIGDNTWQTIITQEGLNAVQKLLKKTASKSTAVSCHWIRSRSRSDFLWVVGNRDEFDENGIVAVNYGMTQRFIGEKEIMIDEIYANTNGQRLDQHLFAVGYVAKKLIEQLVPNERNLAKATFMAGCWHDMGKIDGGFQDWVTKGLKKQKKLKDISEDGEHIDKQTGKFSWQKYPRHNEFSLLLFEILSKIEAKESEPIKHAIYWHHAKPLREKKNEIKNLVGIFNKMGDLEEEYSNGIDTLKAILESIMSLKNEYEELEALDFKIKVLHFDDIEEKIEGVALPLYKRYSTKESIDGYKFNIGFNARNNLVRTAIVTADRLISSLSSDELDSHILNQTLESMVENVLQKERGLGVEIKACLDGFEEKYPNSQRNKEQSQTVKKLCDEEVTIGVLNGPAGCGKTKIALEWALKSLAKKIYWVCPRVQVCEGIFNDLCSDEYLPNAHIEIVTGEIKKSKINGKEQETKEGQEFSADIVITTIDQVVNSITTHKNIVAFMDFMNAHVVFDEYHEYITMQGFNLLFAELIEAKKLQQNDETLANTLLVSATPNPLFIEKLLRLNKDDIIGMKSFNESLYCIDFIEYDDKDEANNPLKKEQQEKETFVISNTAITAQQSFIEHQNKENGILFHSKFIKSDKEFLFNEIYESFKQYGIRKYDILRSGPVVQASLNITSKKMISEMTHAENFLQRLGRLDRFGENDEVNSYIIAITKGVKEGKSKDSSSRFLNELDALQSAKAWYVFLEEKVKDKELTINELYRIYEAFYEYDGATEMIEQDLISSLKKSVHMIEANVLDPKSFPKSKKEDKGGVKVKKNSLRGNSLFCQMAKCQIDSIEEIKILNEYAYDDAEEVITVETTVIEGYGDSNKNLLSFMAKKHHNIKESAKKAYKDAQLRGEARDPNNPIYLSYTPQDLQKVNCEPHAFAQYYAIGLKQSIGILSLAQLKKQN